jgi:restriction system protein
LLAVTTAIHKSSSSGRIYFLNRTAVSPTRAISVDIIRSLYGVVEENKASGGLIVTTSYFSREALKLHQKLQYRLDLKAYKNLCNWLNKHNIYS